MKVFPSTPKGARNRPRGKLDGGVSALLFSLLLSWPVLAETPALLKPSIPGTVIHKEFVTVKHLGESAQQGALRDRQLLTHRETTDPFGMLIRGPFKGLPPVVEHPIINPALPKATMTAVIEPTLEKAVQELSIGGVNVAAHEILVGSRLIREGDLLVLESGVRQFSAWVESVEVGGVYFSDINLQKRFLKPFVSAPKVLPSGAGPKGLPDSWESSDIHQFLNQDASP